MLELTLWRILGVSLDSILLLSWYVTRGILNLIVLDLLILIRTVVELSVEFAAVQVQDELPDLAGGPHVLVLGEQVHVTEGVDGDQRQIFFGLSKMMQRMSELEPICCQEAHLTPLTQQLVLD